MAGLRVILFFIVLQGFFLRSSALPELPPLPSLGSMGDATTNKSAVGSEGQKLKKEESAPLDVRASTVDTSVLDDQGKDLSGSWWKKRHWLLKARELQEKANSLVVQIQALGLPSYDAKRASFGKDVASFYEKIGMEQGQVGALLDELAPYFYPAGKAVEGQLVTDNSSYLSTSKKFQDYFDATVMVAQLKADLKAVVDLEAGVSERVAVFEKTCQDAVQKAAEAQSVINEMFVLVNHDAARDLYYKLDGIVSYLEALLKFVKTDLASDLDRIIGLARTRMTEVSKVIATARSACENLKSSAEEQPEKKAEDVVLEPSLKKQETEDVVVAKTTAEESPDVVAQKETLGLWDRIKIFLMSFV